MSDMILKAPSAWRTLSRNLLLWFALFVVALLVLAMIAGRGSPRMIRIWWSYQTAFRNRTVSTGLVLTISGVIFFPSDCGARISLGTVAITLVIIMTLGLVIGGIAGLPADGRIKSSCGLPMCS